MSNTAVVRGLVLRQAEYKESSRMLTVLTDGMGKIPVSARGAGRRGSRTAAASQLFAFSEMTLSQSRDRWYLNDANTIELFRGLTEDIAAFALGAYFLDLMDAVCQEGVDEPEILSLGLRALWLLSEGKKERALIKCSFELRLMSLLGYRPELERCAGCAAEDIDAPVLDLRGGELYCAACAEKHALSPRKLCGGSLSAMRYIVLAQDGKEFSFSLKDAPLKRLGATSEAYVREQLERSFASLAYYKGIEG
ncbi:MAG: DNA repair protein RecO [Oscillospiraceae bacterium]|nr:DNA repair protein RecO [Oscillospiraceae bacterium]